MHEKSQVIETNWLTGTVRNGRRSAGYDDQFTTINDLQTAVLSESNSYIFTFVSEQLDLQKYHRSILFSTVDRSFTEKIDFDNVRAIINFKPLNFVKAINGHISAIYRLLPDAGIYIGVVETYWERKKKIYGRFGKRYGQLIWIMDSMINRVLPRLRVIEKVYRIISGGNFHTVSSTELLGRLVYMGFSIIDTITSDGMVYFSVIKTGNPLTENEPSYYPIIRLSRVGKNGKSIGVYKFRTMHPYSEFIQDYIVKLNGYDNVGKPKNDWRVTLWGKWMRKLWLDELPQLINVLKLEMKIVGVRPLSRFRFDQFPEDIKKQRIKFKPGCIPPYVALNMPDAIGNIEAEKIYIKDKINSPYLTDIRYFFKAIYNILSNKIRSA